MQSHNSILTDTVQHGDSRSPRISTLNILPASNLSQGAYKMYSKEKTRNMRVKRGNNGSIII